MFFALKLPYFTLSLPLRARKFVGGSFFIDRTAVLFLFLVLIFLGR